MTTQYIGEHLVTGILGRAFIWASFIFLVASVVFYVLSIRNNGKKTQYLKLGSALFILHFAALIGSITALYYLIGNHYFEYAYVWQYSSLDMPVKFMVSCFWAGQEGSYLIWAFWQGLIGLILLKTAKDWKPWVMAFFASGQFFLLTMVLGLRFGNFSIGGSPFMLLRQMTQNQGIDLFNDPNYLKMITDGNGLNPLLENVWMIIHPPALFLGYAVALVPFSYAFASLVRKEYHTWLKPGIVWSIATLLTLGIGIILGGRWAYESLTFGGFWAWDPVENASLVPWLLMVAALHTMLISRKRFHGYATAYLFTFLGWFFVVYATYLTRSGVLGETSVHSFGTNALSWQMALFCLLYLIVPLVALGLTLKKFPKNDSDIVMSREFWMLAGSVILVLSAFQVISTTSIPVFNKLFGSNVAPPVNNVHFYNTWQLPFALVASLIMAVSHYLFYGKNETRSYIRSLLIDAAIALALTVLIGFGDHIQNVGHFLLLFASVFVLVSALHYIIKYISKTSNIAAALTHTGFSVFLIGVILAFSNSQIISRNTSGFDLGEDASNAENLVLMKGIPQPMGDYMVTYSNAETRGKETFYQVDFVKKQDTASHKIAFTVHPSVNANTRMGNVYNPDTKHFIAKDIYTYISFSQQSMGMKDAEGYAPIQQLQLKENDTAIVARSFLILDKIATQMAGHDTMNAQITANFRVLSMQKGELKTEIKYGLANGEVKRTDGLIEPLNIKLRFDAVDPTTGGIFISVLEKQQDYIVIKAIIFPFMIVLWAGVFIMVAALTYAIIRRTTRKGKEQTETIETQSR